MGEDVMRTTFLLLGKRLPSENCFLLGELSNPSFCLEMESFFTIGKKRKEERKGCRAYCPPFPSCRKKSQHQLGEGRRFKTSGRELACNGGSYKGDQEGR